MDRFHRRVRRESGRIRHLHGWRRAKAGDISSFERHRPRLDSRRQEHPLPLRPLQRASEPLHEAFPGLPARGSGEAPSSSSREPDYFFPDGTKIAYLETSQEFRTWKRYRGGWSLPIAIYDLKKNSYEELPKTTGMDLFPMWYGNAIYFISDREGVMNLYSYDLGSQQTKKLTDYKEYDIKWPSLGPDGIVYENGGLLNE